MKFKVKTEYLFFFLLTINICLFSKEPVEYKMEKVGDIPFGEDISQLTYNKNYYPANENPGPHKFLIDNNGNALIRPYVWDSPFDFNYKMIKKREMIKDWYTDETKNIPNGLDRKTLKKWRMTRAPLNRWMQYIHGKIGDVFPYMASIGLYNHSSSYVEDGENVTGDELNVGVDCIGFAQRAASYQGNTYKWRDLVTGITEGNEEYNQDINGRKYPLSSLDGGEESYLILSKEDYDIFQLIPSVIKPGDIFIYGPTTHIAIIQSVDYSGNGSINLSSIKLIEATYNGTQLQQVDNIRKIDELIEEKLNWRILRLK